MTNKKLRELLRKKEMDAFLASSLESITYLTGFSGFFPEDRDAYVLITQKEAYIFTHGIYKEAVEKSVKNAKLVSITREDPFAKQLETLLTKNSIKKLGIEVHNLTAAEYIHLKKFLTTCKLLPADELVTELRIVKTSLEIDAIQKACRVGDETFDYILKEIRLGITEKELAFLLESYIKQHGDDISFPAIVAFGSHASLPHHRPTDTKLKMNEFVLLDFGAKVDNYCSDMTRTVIFGKATDKQKHMYQTVLDAQQKVIDFLNSEFLILNSELKSVKANSLDKTARDYIISQGYDSMPHSLGHGIGLAVHESPRLTISSKDKLIPGMVFSIEPGIYIPDYGGVRIEDLVVLEKTIPRLLTHAPNQLIEI